MTVSVAAWTAEEACVRAAVVLLRSCKEEKKQDCLETCQGAPDGQGPKPQMALTGDRPDSRNPDLITWIPSPKSIPRRPHLQKLGE